MLRRQVDELLQRQMQRRLAGQQRQPPNSRSPVTRPHRAVAVSQSRGYGGGRELASDRPSLRLRPNRERSLKRRHPWVFSGAVAEVDGRRHRVTPCWCAAATARRSASAPTAPSRRSGRACGRSIPTHAVDDAFVAGRVVAAAARRERAAGRRHRLGAAGVQRGRRRARPGGRPLRRHHRRASSPPPAPMPGATCWPMRCCALPGCGVRVRTQRCRRARTRRARRAHRAVARRRPVSRPRRQRGRFRFAVDVAGGHKTGFYLDQRNARCAVADVAEWSAGAQRVLVHRRVQRHRRRTRRGERHVASIRPARRSPSPHATPN